MLKTTYTCSNQAKKTAMSAANSISTVSPLKIEYLLGQRGKEMVNLQWFLDHEIFNVYMCCVMTVLYIEVQYYTSVHRNYVGISTLNAKIIGNQTTCIRLKSTLDVLVYKFVLLP